MSTLYRSAFKYFILIMVLAGLTLSGCSTSREGAVFNSQSGNHVAGWISSHPLSASADINSCKSCHGNDLSGGIANQTCFTSACHHDTKPGWVQPAGQNQEHGAAAKSGVPGSGLTSCQVCHGSTFAGNGPVPTCLDNASCHGTGVNSPHPPSPWRGSPTHIDTDAGNAPVCALCHLGGGSVVITPPTPVPPGTNPGCFNNTLCHGDKTPHLLGASWRDPLVGGAGFHGIEAKADILVCKSCHSSPGTTDFAGGIAPTACSDLSCHPDARAHPVPWNEAPEVGFPPYTASHRNSGNRSNACSICHKVDGPGAGPDAGAPSCFSASFNSVTCHANGPGQPNHSVPNLDAAHLLADQNEFDTNCGNCHGKSGSSPVSSAPVCLTCHQGGDPVNGSFPNCTSCHGEPPDSAGPYPNIQGAHPVHLVLNSAGTPVDCVNCHSGVESGSLAHYNRANAIPGKDALRTEPGDVTFNGQYDANSGSSVFNSSLAVLECSNVSCHGGVTTPNWRTGAIDITVDTGDATDGCRRCHTLNGSESNSPVSGRHQKHLEQLGAKGNALCTECHNMFNGSQGANNHFAFLATGTLEGPPADTIEPNSGDPSATYDPGNQTCSNFTCHTQQHTNFSWSGGAAHAVPYLDPAHTASTQGDFNGFCGGCHAITGSSPLPSAPACTVCHQSGSPYVLTNCTSCHAEPPDSAGGPYPNYQGAHPTHLSLNTGLTPVDCVTCHSGRESGSQAHYDRANARPGKDALRVEPGDIVFDGIYNAKSGSSAFDNNLSNLRCSNVSCHGGQNSPNWRTGSLDVDTECLSCHQLGTSQFNGFSSGKHSKHRDKIPQDFPGIVPFCVACHNVSNLSANHFTALSTTLMEGPASATIGGTAFLPISNWDPGAKSCNPTCHGNKNW